MGKLEIKYRLEGKALPPRPIKLAIGGWGGLAEKKKENGSQAEPWHCPVFVDGCTHGFELLYQYETECHIVNDGGVVRIEWEREREPGIGATSDFTLSTPAPPTEYLFGTSLDIQSPPGYVLRVETHPRFFRDQTNTVPAAFTGHVQSEWWPKKLFMVFKIPSPGQRHIFRKGEPYAQILFIPRDDYEIAPMTEEEQANRRRLEEEIRLSKSLIAKRVWNSFDGIEFNDHYTVLLRAFEQEGQAGVERIVREGVEMHRAMVPHGKSIAEYLEMAKAAHGEKKNIEAKEILHHVLKLEPRSAEAYIQMAALESEQKVPISALSSVKKAVAIQPGVPQYRLNLAELYRRLGRLDLAQRQIQAALDLAPNNAPARVALGRTLAQRGLIVEGIEQCRIAASMQPKAAAPYFVVGQILKDAGQRDEARAAFQTALTIEPDFEPAKKAIAELDGAPPQPDV